MLQLAIVKWVDSTSFGSWETIECVEKSELKLCYAFGALITDNSEKVTLALLCDDNKDVFSNWINIPKANVKSMLVVAELYTEKGELCARINETTHTL